MEPKNVVLQFRRKFKKPWWEDKAECKTDKRNFWKCLMSHQSHFWISRWLKCYSCSCLDLSLAMPIGKYSIWFLTKIVKLCLHSSLTVHNFNHFDEIFEFFWLQKIRETLFTFWAKKPRTSFSLPNFFSQQNYSFWKIRETLFTIKLNSA